MVLRDTMELQQYWNAIKSHVCRKCIDSDGFGNCLIDPSIDCTLGLYLPKVVDIVNRIHSDTIDAYIDELRARVCPECKYQTATGTCVLRPSVECPLDRYFPLVVQIIEATSASVPQRSNIPTDGTPSS